MGWARWSCCQNLKWFTNASARYSSRTTVHESRSMSVKVLYTTHAVATGGRNGHTRSADGRAAQFARDPRQRRDRAARGRWLRTGRESRGNIDVGHEVSGIGSR
jgi:hypothetical protein